MVLKAKIAWAVMENHGFRETSNLKSHLYIRYHPNCIWYSNYYATNHPSGPNYRVLAAGTKITDDETYNEEFPCLASLIKGKAAVINLKGNIALRHNPYKDMCAPHDNFTSYTDIDLFGQYNHLYFGWDDQNNAHSGSLEVADQNLLDLINHIEKSKWFEEGNIFLFTWDESFADANNQVACFALSKQFQNKNDNRALGHYNFCKTMYDNYGLTSSYLKNITETLF